MAAQGATYGESLEALAGVVSLYLEAVAGENPPAGRLFTVWRRLTWLFR